MNAAAKRANVGRQNGVSKRVYRYFQADGRRLGHAEQAATVFLFVRSANMAHVGPRDARGGLLGRSSALAVPVATGANVGVRGPVVAQKKAVAVGGTTGHCTNHAGTSRMAWLR